MVDTKVMLTSGEVTLRKPTAGVRNRAFVAADTGKENPNFALFMHEMLVGCIVLHPWGMTPLRGALDSLDIDEYDKLITAMKGLVPGVTKDEAKKSEPLSSPESSQKTSV